MTSASAFANLDSVGSNGQLTVFKTSRYEIVVSGMYDGLVQMDMVVTMLVVGNAQLGDLGNLLMIQDSRDVGTYVGNNGKLCFSAAVGWSQRPQSYLEYSLGQVCDVALA